MLVKKEGFDFFPFFIKRFPFGKRKELWGYFFLQRLGSFGKVNVVVAGIDAGLGVKVNAFTVRVVSDRGVVDQCKVSYCEGDESSFFAEIEKKVSADCVFLKEELFFLKDFVENLFEDKGEVNFFEVFSYGSFFNSREPVKVCVLGENGKLREERFRIGYERGIVRLTKFLKRHDSWLWEVYPEVSSIYVWEGRECYECGGLAFASVEVSGIVLFLCKRCYYLYKKEKNKM